MLALSPATEQLISLALEEDLGRGDVTTEAVVPAGLEASAYALAKEPLVLFGLDVCARVFERVDPAVRFVRHRRDGELLAVGDRPFEVHGTAAALLAGERTALNFLQRLSGVATQARRYQEACAGTRARVVDTRKTTPGWRALEKAAVAAGGAHNHRADLASGILIKDNHIVAAGGVGKAVRAARARAPHPLRIEVEVKDLAELDQALEAGAEIVLLDNMDDALCEKAVARVAGRAIIEVSGGITLPRIERLARMGVDLISAGALTHSARAVDLSLELELRSE
jgi:nicotinate-nucleotide pyrophosphorylase (carboxylating)